jgi:hypothetical protein
MIMSERKVKTAVCDQLEDLRLRNRKNDKTHPTPLHTLR